MQAMWAIEKVLLVVVSALVLALTWSSEKQETVALSTSKPEYTSANLTARQALWLRKLLEDFSYEQNESTKTFYDKKSANSMPKNPSFHDNQAH